MTALTSNEPEQRETVQAIEGPGARLRKARESLGLDQVRVAAQLHLSETMIEALEWDDYEALPGSVFTQGYLRNYARLLGLPESEIIQAYRQMHPGDDQTRLSAKGAVQLKNEMRSGHGLVQLATWSIIIGLAALLFFWWQGRFGWEEAPLVDGFPETELTDEPLVQEDPAVDLPGIAEPYVEPFEAQRLEEPAEAVSQEPPVEPVSGALEQAPPALPEAVEDRASAASETVEAAAETPLPPAAEIATPITPAAEPLPEAQTRGQLIFEFDGRCWAEVRDASGKAHIIGEKQAGYRRVIESDLGPFKVVLGDATKVRVTLDGEPYDLAPHTRGVVARFTLETE